MAFVDDDQAEAAHVRQVANGPADREHLAPQPVLLAVVLPHGHEVLRADDQNAHAVVVFENAREGRGHQRLAQPDDVADQHAVALVDVVCGDAHGRFLELEEAVLELARDAEFRQARPRFLRKVVGHLDIDVVGRDRRFARPAFLDDLDELFGDVDAKTVVPAALEPVGQFLRGVVIQHIDVQLALPGQPGQGQVAAAEVSDDGVDGIGTKQQVELGVQRMPQKQLNDDLFSLRRCDSLRKPASSSLLGAPKVSWRRNSSARRFFHPDGGLVVDRLALAQQAQSFAKLLLGRFLHSHQQPAGATAIRPVLDMIVELFPPAQVEIADTKISPVGDMERLHQHSQQLRFDVVEDTRHWVVSSAGPIDFKEGNIASS